jgi:CDP-glycerol glycerophosphotransferase (TagB/SpsB family)
VGRPQLDLDIDSPLSESELTTITYAPTWEGEDEVNNYTSVDLYGPQIVEAALAVPHARLVYKPHPQVVESADPLVRANHKKIVDLISRAGAPHAYLPKANILGILPETDLLIADVSSVTLDYLYLRPHSPILLSDRRSNPAQLLADSPMSAACAVIDQNSISHIGELMTTALDADTHRDDRARMRTYYFGDTAKGSSTQAFWSAITSEIAAYESALSLIQRVRQVQS